MTTSDLGASGRYRDAFASAEFRVVFGAFVVSMLGNVVAGLALTVLVYRQTTSSLLSALTFTMTFLPYLVGGTLLSGLVDRVPPRRLLAGCDLGAAAIVVVMTVPGLPIPALFALLFAMSLLPPLSSGTRGALLRDILPAGAVVPGRSLLRTVAQGAQIAGYAAGGGLLAALSPQSVLGVQAAAFAVSALVLRLLLRPRHALRRTGGSLARDSLRGVRDVLRVRPLRRVLLLGLVIPFLMVAPEALAAPSVAARGLPSSATGWWLAAMPLGMVAGEVAGIVVIPAARRGTMAAPLAACGFVPLLVFALNPPLTPALVLLVTGGLSAAYLMGFDQLFLDATPPELLGRAYTVNSSGVMAVQGLGFAVAGALGELLSPDSVIAVEGAAGLAAVAALWLPPERVKKHLRSGTRRFGGGPGRRRGAR